MPGQGPALGSHGPITITGTLRRRFLRAGRQRLRRSRAVAYPPYGRAAAALAKDRVRPREWNFTLIVVLIVRSLGFGLSWPAQLRTGRYGSRQARDCNKPNIQCI